MKNLFLIMSFFFLVNNAWGRELIAYSHLTNETWQIWVMEPDGKGKRQVTFTQQDKRGPTWVNKGKKIAFRTSNSQLYTVDLNGSNEERILSQYGVVTNPNFSKANNEIVFIRFDPRGKDRADIWKSDLMGARSKLLTRDKIGKYQPRFSPRGDKIAFVQMDNNTKDYHIWMMDADGGNPRQLTTGKGFDTHPDFAPDGNIIVFCSNRRDHHYEIYTLNSSSGILKQLTHGAGSNTQPRFSADGKKIVFVSDRSGDQQIWLMDNDGSNPVALTDEKTESIDPDWGEAE